MASSERAIPTTLAEAQILRNLDSHKTDTDNPHGTKLAQLADLTNAVAGTAGQVPTKQADGTYLLETPPGAAGGAPVGSAVPKGASGDGDAGVSSSASRQDHVHPALVVAANDYGLIGWSIDPINASGTLTMTAGTMYFARVKVASAGPITSVMVPLSGGGAGTTSSWVGVYALDGTQLGVSADQGAGWVSAGTKTVALTAPTASLDAGTTVLLAVLSIGGQPVVRSGPVAAAVNAPIPAASGYRFGSLAAQSALPSPLTLSGTSSATTPLLLIAL